MRDTVADALPLPWIMGTRAAFSIAFAIAAFVAPRAMFDALAIFWGIYAFSDGIVATSAGVVTRWWSLASAGIAMLVAGVCAFLRPDVTGRELLPVIAVWASLRGLFDFSAAATIARRAAGKRALIANGAVSVCFALLLTAVPEDTAAVHVLASYALITGIILSGTAR